MTSIRRSVLASTLALLLTPALAHAQTDPQAEPSTAPATPATTSPPGAEQGVTAEEAAEIARKAVAEALAAERARVAAEAEAAKRAQSDDQSAVGGPGATRAGEGDYLSGDSGFVDTRLNFTLTNENLLAKPGETIPSVPGWRFGRPNSLGTLFFDNYDTRFSGYETMSNAIMYRNYRKDHLEVEGAFVMRINEIAERRLDLSDAGSYVLVSWWKDPAHKDPTRVQFTAFPVSSDRFRLGYSYRLSWGGNDEYRAAVQLNQPVPGFKLQYTNGKGYAFVGAKTSVTKDEETAELEAKQAVLAGGGYDVNDNLRLEVNGGYFNRGSNQLEDVKDQDVQLYGVSGQIAYHVGMPVGSSVDYALYKYDPERIGRVFQKTKYPGGTQWLAMSELTYLAQTLKDPEKTGSTKVQPGVAGDINLRVMMDRVRFRFDAQYRDLAFILHSVPSLPTYSDFPAVYKIKPNFFAAAGVDRNWNDRLTLGAVVGMELPASLTTPAGIPGDTSAVGETTAVIRNNGQDTVITVLPTKMVNGQLKGEERAAQFAVKGSAQVDFGDIYAALLDVYYSYDPNQTRLARSDPEAPFHYEFGEFNQLGVNVTLQAKF
ncbi:MAG TPA: hypothetical protein VHE35_35485 [Kofleriaceae bacterium]|nr:hypothetical protein [Kofleriaceae bacterium]